MWCVDRGRSGCAGGGYSHAHSQMVIEAVARIKETFGRQVQLIGRECSHGRGTWSVDTAGVDCGKWIGRARSVPRGVIAGVGVPQVTAIYDCARVAKRYNVPVIGMVVSSIRVISPRPLQPGRIQSCWKFAAGVDESPGELIISHGERFKDYRGMGSIGAMKQRRYSKHRYFQGEWMRRS